MSSHPARTEEIATLASQCVMCGLCLPHCPSYRVSSNEGDGPRGRIALAASLQDGPASAVARAHLDRCLGCLSCAEVCPAHVDYARIIDLARAELQSQHPDPLPRWLDWLVRRPRTMDKLARLRRLLPERLLRRLVPTLARTPRWQAPIAYRNEAATRSDGCVHLFAGCVGSAAEADTLSAAQQLLSRAGYRVEISQNCCGALHQHAGLSDTAGALATTARAAVGKVDAVILIGSGCRRMLGERVFCDAAAPPIHELMEFLLEHGGLARLQFMPVDATVAWLRPCSLSPRAEQATLSALAQVPGLQVQPLPLQPRCCGAAGSYWIRQPETAMALRGERLAQLHEMPVSALLTSNIGCRGWMDDGLRDSGRQLAVMHPARLLADQLQKS